MLEPFIKEFITSLRLELIVNEFLIYLRVEPFIEEFIASLRLALIIKEFLQELRL